jgi:hypothetical protein
VPDSANGQWVSSTRIFVINNSYRQVSGGVSRGRVAIRRRRATGSSGPGE